MNPLYNILEGILDADDISTKIDNSLAADTWNRFIATIKLIKDGDYPDKEGYNEIVGLIDNVVKANKLRASKAWPIKSTWKDTPDCIVVTDNMILVCSDRDARIIYWDKPAICKHGWTVINASEYSNDHAPKDLFFKVGNDRSIRWDGADIYDLGEIHAVYKLPKNFFTDRSRISVYAAFCMYNDEAVKMKEDGINPYA